LPFAYEVRRRLGIHQLAELPEFLRRTGELEDRLVDVEGIQFAGTVAVDGSAHVVEELSQWAS
jgi:hypothetical protein